MRLFIALASATRIAAADPNDPAITADGTRIIVPYKDEDGARGEPNLTVLVADRKGAITQRIEVVAFEKGPVPEGEAAKAKLYAETKPRPLVLLAPMNPKDFDTHRTYDGLTVDLSESGTLSVQPAGHGAIRRGKPTWRTKPTASQAAALDKKRAAGELPCFNPAGIGPVWVDIKQRVAVLYVRYHGSDSCWEPSSDFAVLAW